MAQWNSEQFWVRFVVASLATWRVAHLVAHEDGPWDLVARLRERAGAGFWGTLLDCFYCLSMWAAMAFTAVVTMKLSEIVPTWLALSGAACLLERATARPLDIERLELDAVTPQAADEDGTFEGGDDVLRTEAGASEGPRH